MLDDLATAVRTVAERAGGSVVRVGRGRRGGCGVHVGDGRVLTNAHNVGQDEATIVTVGGETLRASVAGVDVDGDLAVLTVPLTDAGVSFSERPVTTGMPVFALGVAHHGVRLTFGVVSAVGQPFRGPGGRRIGDAIEHTAPVAPGSSGSALLDLEGALIGLSSRRLEGGFSLAIPTDAALRSRVERLAGGERIERPRLGIAIAPSWVAQRMRAAVGLPSREGLLIREVEADGSAAAAGLAVGDLIVAVAGRPITDPDDLQEAIVGAARSLVVTIVRGEQAQELTVTLA